MSESSYNKFVSEVGRVNMGADYPWSYDPLLMREYFEGTGYKPGYLWDAEAEAWDKDRYRYICNALYGSLKAKGDFDWL